MSVSFSDFSAFSFSEPFMRAIEVGLSPSNMGEMNKCIALFDQAPCLYLNGTTNSEALRSMDYVIQHMSFIARNEPNATFAKQATALLQSLAIKGYPLAQREFARYLEKQEPNKSNHARLYYSLLVNNRFAPEYMKRQVPPGMCFKLDQVFDTPMPEPNTPYEDAWQGSDRQKWWNEARLPEITGIRSPADFTAGRGRAESLPFVPEVMLGTYELPVTKCIEDEYIKDIYKTMEDKDAFYNTVTNYKMPRLSWADRISTPLLGMFSRFKWARDFLSEGHRMCAAADVILMWLARDIYTENPEKKTISRKALALDTIHKMAKNGFPNAQVFMAKYLREQAIEQGQPDIIAQAREFASDVFDNPYATYKERSWAIILKKEMSMEEQHLMKLNRIKQIENAREQANQRANMKQKAPKRRTNSLKREAEKEAQKAAEKKAQNKHTAEPTNPQKAARALQPAKEISEPQPSVKDDVAVRRVQNRCHGRG